MKDGRWAFMSRKVIGSPDNPMMVRWRLIQTPWGGIYLHFIHREDLDRMPHDHPWVFRSLILRGAYTEEYYPDVRLIGSKSYVGTDRRQNRTWRIGQRHTFPAGAAHRITKTHGKITTLVVVGPKFRTWGFYDGAGRFIDWREYHGQANGWTEEQEVERYRAEQDALAQREAATSLSSDELLRRTNSPAWAQKQALEDALPLASLAALPPEGADLVRRLVGEFDVIMESREARAAWLNATQPGIDGARFDDKGNYWTTPPSFDTPEPAGREWTFTKVDPRTKADTLTTTNGYEIVGGDDSARRFLKGFVEERMPSSRELMEELLLHGAVTVDSKNGKLVQMRADNPRTGTHIAIKPPSFVDSGEGTSSKEKT